MRFIIFLYLLIASFTRADAERYMELKRLRGLPKPVDKPFRSAAPFGQAPLFPSLPAAVHWQDSADIWRKSLGAAKTGFVSLPSGSSIPILKHVPSLHPVKNDMPLVKAVDYYKRLRGGV